MSGGAALFLWFSLTVVMMSIATLFQKTVASHQAGDFVTAANGYAEVLTREPAHADAWHLVGVLSYQNGRPAKALKQILQAIEINPTNAEYFSNFAIVLLGTGQNQAAIEAASRSISIDPNCHQSHLVKGKALVAMNQLSEASSAFESAIASGGDETEISIELANLLQIQGQIPEAIRQYQKIIEVTPDHAQAYIELAKYVATGQFEFDEPAVEHMHQLVSEAGVGSVNQKVRLSASIAVHYQAAKKFDQAFEYFSQANQWLAAINRQSKRVAFDASQLERETTQIIETFPKEQIRQFQSSGISSQVPVFIIGMPRSGTTLVHQLIACHSMTAGLGELTIVGDMFADQILKTEQNAGQETKLSEKAEGWVNIDAKFIDQSAAQYLSHVQSMQRQVGSKPATRTLDKMPSNYKHVGFVKMMFPDAKIIHCVRDPRDVCLSCFTTLFDNAKLQSATASLENAADLFASYHRLMSYWETIFKEEIYRLDYQEVVTDPESQIQRVLEYLELPHEQCEIGAKDAPVIQTASIAQASQPIYRSSIGKWRNYEKHLGVLSERLANEIESYQHLGGSITPRARGNKHWPRASATQ